MDTERVLRRAAREITAGTIVNLGIGLPTRLMAYLPDDMDVMIHSENGILGAWKQARGNNVDASLIDAGGDYITTRPGSSFFDSAVSFAMIRRGKVDLSIMGAFQVDQAGNLANWKIPGQFSPGIGGAMELAQKTPRLLILCAHNDKQGNPKVLRQCTLPLTASLCVSRIITDKAVMDITADGLILRELAENMSLQQVMTATDAELVPAASIGRF
ncbi:MAG: 3-oxoacid CoA-transferase subunit B [Haliea sp.]